MSTPLFKPDPDTGGDHDRKAVKEANALANNRDLKKDGATREHNRHQTFRDHVNRAVIILFWLVCTLLAIGVCIFAWHILTPPTWQFLPAAQLDQLKTILAASLLSGALGGYANSHMKRE